MFTMKEVLSKRNIRMAFEHFEQKKDGSGQDGMKLSDLQEYWQLNSEMICRQLEEGKYIPGIVSNYEIVGNTGKRRTISKWNVRERFLTRLLAQKLKKSVEDLLKNAKKKNAYLMRLCKDGEKKLDRLLGRNSCQKNKKML